MDNFFLPGETVDKALPVDNPGKGRDLRRLHNPFEVCEVIYHILGIKISVLKTQKKSFLPGGTI